MKLMGSSLFLALTLLSLPSAFAVECLSPDAQRVMIIAVAEKFYTEARVTPASRKMEDGSLVCVQFGVNEAGKRVVNQLEFVNPFIPENDKVPFSTLTGNGYSTFRVFPVVGRTKVSTIRCPKCVASADKVTLQVSVLHKYPLFGSAKWQSISVDVDLTGDLPVTSYKGTPFDVLTLRSESGVGGGVKQMRFSQCNAAKETCLLDLNPIVSHVKTISL